ncbi:MAG: chromate transporter [Hyphomicrobiales bacterium]|nr:MAG: chromate transporter [Hyphomicrobiales bacterium]
MDLNLLGQIAQVFCMLSLISIGGANATLPEIKRQVVDVHGWMSGADFANAFALSNAAPGPNIIIVSLIGWQISGLFGMLVATTAIMVPSCSLAYVAARVLSTYADRAWVSVLKEALTPIALGLILASGVTMMKAADHDVITLLISLGTAAFVVVTSRNVLWALGAGTAVNLIASSLG